MHSRWDTLPAIRFCADSTLLQQFRIVARQGGCVHQRYVGTAQRRHGHAAVLDHNPLRTAAAVRCGQTRQDTTPDGTHRWQRHLRRPRVHMERHILVFSRGGGSLCLLFFLHRPHPMARAEMGKPHQPARQRPLACGYSLCCRSVDRRASAQPALRSGNSACGVLPQS